MFGKRLVSVPVVGNVICGGAEKVIYKADWSALDRLGRPRSLRPSERVIDELDVADLVSEKEHDYAFPRPSMGFVGFRVLPEPLAGQRARELFDAGRVIPPGQSEKAVLRAPKRPARLVVRTVTARRASAEVRVDGRLLGRITAQAEPTWTEPAIDLPADLPERFTLTLTAVEGEWMSYHVWVVEGGADVSMAQQPGR
jgi:hypothetical protein